MTLTREQRTGAGALSHHLLSYPHPHTSLMHTQSVRSMRGKSVGSPGDHDDDSNDSFGLLGTLGVVGTLHPVIPEQLPMEVLDPM